MCKRSQLKLPLTIPFKSKREFSIALAILRRDGVLGSIVLDDGIRSKLMYWNACDLTNLRWNNLPSSMPRPCPLIAADSEVFKVALSSEGAFSAAREMRQIV